MATVKKTPAAKAAKPVQVDRNAKPVAKKAAANTAVVKQAAKAAVKKTTADKKAEPIKTGTIKDLQINGKIVAKTATLSRGVLADLKNAKAGSGDFDPKETAKRVTKPSPSPAVAAKRVTATTAKAYLPKEERKRMLDVVITKLLKRDGLANLTRTAVANEAGVSNSLLRVYYTNADGLKIAAVQNAVDTGDLKTARKAIADGFTASLLTRKAQTALKNAAR